MGLPQSNIDWARYMEGLQGKVNTTADNLTDIGKDNITGLSMPSEKFITIVLGPNNSEYTAPANGYYYLKVAGNNNSVLLNLTNMTTGIQKTNFMNFGMNLLSATISARKNDIVRIYNNGGIKAELRFYYAEGSKGE